MLPSFRTLFGPDVLPRPTIPPSHPHPHAGQRPNDSPVVVTHSRSSSAGGAAPADPTSWRSDPAQQPLLDAINDTSSPSSHPLTNIPPHQPHSRRDISALHPIHQGPKAQTAQPLSTRSFPHGSDDPNDKRTYPSSPSPRLRPDMRDREMHYGGSALSSSTSSSLYHPTPQQPAPHPLRYGQSQHTGYGPASIHHRSSTLDSAVSSVPSPPHPTVVNPEATPSPMEAMAAMTISSTRPSDAAPVAPAVDSRVEARQHYDSFGSSTFQGRPANEGSGSVPHSPSGSLVRLSITESRGSSVSPPRRSYADPLQSQHDRHSPRATPPLYHESRTPSLLGAEFHPPPDMDIDYGRPPTVRMTIQQEEQDQFSSQASPVSHAGQPPPQSHWAASSASHHITGTYSPKDHAYQEMSSPHAQAPHRLASAQTHLYSGEARVGVLDDVGINHRSGHYQPQANSQQQLPQPQHPSLHDQSSHQRMHDPVRVSDQRTHPSYLPHPSSSLSLNASSPSSRPIQPPYTPSSFSIPSHTTTPASPLSPPSGPSWPPTASVPETLPLPQQALSPRMSKNHDGLVHRSSHSSLAHHPDRFATSSPSLRVGSNSTSIHSQHLRQASAGQPNGHIPSRHASDHVVSPTASYAHSHSPAHPGIRRPHSARLMGESSSHASGMHESGTHPLPPPPPLPHAPAHHDYVSGGNHAMRPSPYPPRRRTESVPSSPQFTHSRADRSWTETHRHDAYDKFPRHQRSNTTHGHGTYETFSKILSSSSELRDRPPFPSSSTGAPSASLLASPPPLLHNPRKTSEASTVGYPTVRPSASEPDLERVYGGRPAAQNNGQTDYWAKPSFGMDEHRRNDQPTDAKGAAMPLRKGSAHSRAQDEHGEHYGGEDDEEGELDNEEGDEEGEEGEDGQDDEEGIEDDDEHVPQHGQQGWAGQDYDRDGYRYGEVPYGGHNRDQVHGLYSDGHHPPDVDGQTSTDHPPLYAPHPYQPLQQYLLRPQRIPKSPKQKPLQPKNSQRGPYLTRQRVLASGIEPGKGPACRYVCSYCQKRFSRPSSLRIHTYSHTGERPFKCTEKGCERQFSVQSNMRRHLRVHRMDKIKFLDPIYPSQIANDRPSQSRPQQQQQPSLPQQQPPHHPTVDHRMVPPLPLVGTVVSTPIHN